MYWKSKVVSKVISILIVQSFFTVNLSWANEIAISSQAERNLLSPTISISQPMVKTHFQDLAEKDGHALMLTELSAEADKKELAKMGVDKSALFVKGIGKIPTMQTMNFMDKRVVDRVDFNVPVSVEFDESGNVMEESITITDSRRIEKELPNILYMLEHGAKYITIVTHFEPKVETPETDPVTGKKITKKIAISTRVIAGELKKLLPEYGDKIMFLAGSVDKKGLSVKQNTLDDAAESKGIKLFVTENIRNAKGEKSADEKLIAQISALADLYVVDAFGALHREHASMLPAEHVKKAVGFLVEDEVRNLSKAFNPKHPLVAIFGGSKVEDKVDAINNFIEDMQAGDAILIGGAMAYTFLKARNPSIALGDSMIQEDKIEVAKEVLEKAKAKGVRLYLPTDHIATLELKKGAVSITTVDIEGNYMGVDIGNKTLDEFKSVLKTAGTVVWNGPLGVFEEEKGGFSAGSFGIARYLDQLAEEGVAVIIGGGDTPKAVKKAGVKSKKIFMSTGGGASVEFLNKKGILKVLWNIAGRSFMWKTTENLDVVETKETPAYLDLITRSI